jgi:SAM-dependent methyltransferase
MLVPPAFEEERLATIWQVPNVREMLKRTKYLLNNPEAADVAIKQAQEHVISKFNQNTVCDQFNEVLFETVTEESREKCWVTNRWGYAPSRFFEASMSSLPELLKRLSPDPRILDVGCFKGELVRACAEQGLDVTGIESLQAAIDSAGTRAQMRITRKGFLPEWPEADILILTGVYDLIVQEASSRPESCDAVQNFGSRLLNYEWILVWNEPSGRWDIRSHSSEDLNAILSAGHTRRHDLEDIAKQAVTQGLLHEIWQRGKDTSEIPQGLMVSHE